MQDSVPSRADARNSISDVFGTHHKTEPNSRHFMEDLRLHENSPNSLKASHFSLSCIDPASFLAAAVEIFVRE
jgi:hypothetical protein